MSVEIYNENPDVYEISHSFILVYNLHVNHYLNWINYGTIAVLKL